MPATSAPYFLDESLRQRFVQDVIEAAGASRIAHPTGQWLRALADGRQSTAVLPRVDRLLIGDQPPVTAELASAFIISDPADPAAPVYLSTIMFGIETFNDRLSLLMALRQRYPEMTATEREIDVELVEAPLFTRRMQMIVEQQATHLEALTEHLHGMPTLQTAVGQALQERLDAILSHPTVDAFNHLVQIVNPRASLSIVPTSLVLATQTLAEAAYQLHVEEQLQSGLSRQFLDRQGAALDQAGSQQYIQALDATHAEVANTYERLLADYWTTPRDGSWTMRQVAAAALAETFREGLLRNLANGLLSQGEYRRLRQLVAPAAAAPGDSYGIKAERVVVTFEGHPDVKLAGLLLLECTGSESAGLYLFSSAHGFARLNSRRDLNAFFADARSRKAMLSHASVVDRVVLDAQEGAVELQFQEVAQPVFHSHVDDVIDLQKRNLRHVLSLPSIDHDQAVVRVDDALDIRALLDHKLLGVRGSWRWNDQVVDFEQVWGRAGAMVPQPRDDLPAASDTWADRVRGLEVLVERVSGLHPGVDDYMDRELSRYLAVTVEPGLDTRMLWIGPRGSRPTTRLVSFALESASGAVQVDVPPDWIVQRDLTGGQFEAVEKLPIGLLKVILRRVVDDFPTRYEQHLRRFYDLPVRLADRQISPKALAWRVREDALRLGVAIQQRLGQVAGPALDMLQQVLDRPVAALRESSGQEQVQAYAAGLQFDPQQAPVVLDNAFVLFNPRKPDRYLMWAPGVGTGDFQSLRLIETRLAARLVRVDQSEHVLNLISENDRSRVQEYLARTGAPVIRIVLSRIDGHLIQALQAQEAEHQVVNTVCAYRDAAAWRLKSDVLINLIDSCKREDVNRQILSELRGAIQLIVDGTLLPGWVNDASALDQSRLLAALQRFYIACGQQEDFLFNIPTGRDYSRQQLLVRLKADFPALELDPDTIKVTLTRYVPAPVAAGQVPQGIPAASASAIETLTDFALNRFFAVQDGVLSVQMSDGSAPSPLLTPLYLRNLVRELDVAGSYLRLLDAALQPDNPEMVERQKRFAEQMPAFDMLRALIMVLQNQLSGDAYRLIGSILEMPDGLARLPIAGQYATISPLRLSPQEAGWTPATVLGTYVIAPRDQNTGPWILYSLLEDFVFREYPDKNALLQDIRTSSTLQAYLLERLDERQRRIYDHGGFQEPHLIFSTESSFDVPLHRPKPATIKLEPYQGNALELLFQGMRVSFPWRIRLAITTNDQEWHSASRYLFGLGAEQMLAFLPGRLGALVGIWQSRHLFSASAAAAGERQWGKALSEFTAAVSMLITARSASAEERGVETNVETPVLEIVPAVEFSWSNNALTPDLRNRLRAFEVHDVALNALRRNEMFNTYHNDENQRIYVAISGAVYEVERESGQGNWFIVSEDKRGPAVKLDENQKWVLDLQGGLRGGGGYVSRLRGTLIDREVDDVLVVEAKGMAEIRRVSRAWADSIETAHTQARLYLENCLDNLTLRPPVNAIDPRAQLLIANFFSLHAPGEALYGSLRDAITRLYESLMDPSLSPEDSQRYIVGTNRRWHEPSTAFTFQQDPQKRIFLTEKFFRIPVYRLKTRVNSLRSFRFATHYQAAILIHELTHQVLDTEDIAYVGSFAPYFDLLEDTTAYRMQVKNELIEQQQQVLSYNTDRTKLFKQTEDGIWRDLRHHDGDSKPTILRLTGARTLENARDVFYTDPVKRAAVMMSNADTVALLVTLLGRERFRPRR
jgi:hypothetical protein